MVYISRSYSDFTLIAEGGAKLKLHLNVMASNSSTIESAMNFYKQSDKAEPFTFSIPFEENTVRLLTDIIYGQPMPLFGFDDWIDVIKAADYLGCKEVIHNIINAKIIGEINYAILIDVAVSRKIPDLLELPTVKEFSSREVDAAIKQLSFDDLIWVIKVVKKNARLSVKNEVKAVALLVVSSIGNFDVDKTQLLIECIDPKALTQIQLRQILSAKLHPTTRHLLGFYRKAS